MFISSGNFNPAYKDYVLEHTVFITSVELYSLEDHVDAIWSANLVYRRLHHPITDLSPLALLSCLDG